MKCINAINIGISQTAIPDISVFVFLHNEFILDFFLNAVAESCKFHCCSEMPTQQLWKN